MSNPQYHRSPEFLTLDELSLYDHLVIAFSNKDRRLMGFNFANLDVGKVLLMVKLDYPEFYYYNFEKAVVTQGNILYLDHYIKIDRSREKAVNDAVEEIVAKCATLNSTYEQVLFVYDYLESNVTYSFEDAQLDPQTMNYESFSLLGALLNKKAVCSGYSLALKYILDKLNIECVVLACVQEVDHAFNAVKIGEEWTNIDLTMAIIVKGDLSFMHKNNLITPLLRFGFGLTNDEISAQIIRLKFNDFCPSTSEDFNYYRRHKLCFKSITTLRNFIRTFAHVQNPLILMYNGTYSLREASLIARDNLRRHGIEVEKAGFIKMGYLYFIGGNLYGREIYTKD